jgi:hypothetical protein
LIYAQVGLASLVTAPWAQAEAIVIIVKHCNFLTEYLESRGKEK